MHKNHPVADYAAIVNDETQFIDVREPDEVAGGTLPGTINIPLGTLADRLGEREDFGALVLICEDRRARAR